MNAPATRAERWRHLLTGSLNRRIFSAALVVGSLTFAARVAGMAKEMFVASWFGTHDALDAFLAAFMLPSYAMIVLGNSIDAALIPVFVEAREKEGPAAAQRLLSGTLVFSVGGMLAATLLLAVAAPFLLPLLCPGFPPEKLLLTRQLFYLFLPGIVLAGLITNCESALKAGEKFALASVVPCVVPLATVAALALCGARWGIHSLAFGIVGGMLLQFAILAWSLHRRGLRLSPRWHGFDPGLRRVVRQYLPAVGASAIMCSTPLVDQSMASLLPSGSVSALSYANKFVALLLGIGTMALGTAVLPYFSKLAAQSDWKALRHTLRTYIGLIVLVTIPVVGACIFLSKPLVALLFQRGNFSPADTENVAWIQAMYLLQVPCYTLTILFVRMISSLQANHVLLWGTILSFTVNITFDYVLMQYMGAAGIALSTSIVYTVLSCFLGFVLWRKLQAVSAGA